MKKNCNVTLQSRSSWTSTLGCSWPRWRGMRPSGNKMQSSLNFPYYFGNQAFVRMTKRRRWSKKRLYNFVSWLPLVHLSFPRLFGLKQCKGPHAHKCLEKRCGLVNDYGFNPQPCKGAWDSQNDQWAPTQGQGLNTYKRIPQTGLAAHSPWTGAGEEKKILLWGHHSSLSGLATPGVNVHLALGCLPPTGAGKDPTRVNSFLFLGYSFPSRDNKQTKRYAETAQASYFRHCSLWLHCLQLLPGEAVKGLTRESLYTWRTKDVAACISLARRTD